MRVIKFNTVKPLLILSVLLGFFLRPAVAQESDRKQVVIAAVGDIVLGWHLDRVYRKLEDEGRNPCEFPFSGVRDELEKADVVLGNLEAPFTVRGKKLDKKFNFRVDPRWVCCLKDGGMDVVNLANNHLMDYGALGLKDTLETLKDAGIHFSGAGENTGRARIPAIVKTGGVRIAFLGFSNTLPMEMNAGKEKPGVNFGYPGRIKKDVKRAAKEADFVVVSFHWGSERSHRIKAYQSEYARLAVDSGADVVLGHHPHVLQGIEMYRGKLIAYSLGNFIFGGNRSGDISESMILIITLQDTKVDYRIIPIDIAKSLFQPQIMEGEEGDMLVEKIKAYSTVPMTPEEVRSFSRKKK